MNILFVDDEKIIREGMKEIIDWKRLGCDKLLMAENGSRAIELLESETIDLVITDIYMQKMTGIELAKTIKERWPMVKVIILSAYEDFGYAREAITAGVFQYLLKPIVPEEMEAAILDVMESVNAYRPQMVKDFWKALLRREILTMDDLGKRLSLTGMVLSKGEYSCLVLDPDSDERDQFMRLARRAADQVFDYCAGCVLLNKRYIVMIVNGAAGDGRLHRFLTVLEEQSGGRVRGVCGRPVTDIMDLALSYEDGAAVLASSPDKAMDQDALISEARRLIHQNLSNEAFGVNDVATALHVSAGYFSRAFKKQMGITCIEYLTRKRLEKAGELLTHTGMKHDAVASAVGYANVHYFSMQFKKHTGETPGQYRKRMKKQAAGLGGDNV